jgi:hypothetical protein
VDNIGVLKKPLHQLSLGAFPMSIFLKNVCWLSPEGFRNLEERLKRAGRDFREAEKAVCVALSPGVEIAFAAPDSWGKYEICRRQMSWHEDSGHAADFLVVSSFDLGPWGFWPEAVITETDFRPPLLPGPEEKRRLVERESYRAARPDAWERIDRESGRKWMRTLGLGNGSFDDLFLSHCANHANFIEPEFFAVENGQKVPYSTAGTREICSACMEFYNIIGREHEKKLVVPCPGAVLFAGLPVNRYFAVTCRKRQKTG